MLRRRSWRGPATSSWRQEPEGAGCAFEAEDYFCHKTTDALITHQGHPRHNWVHKVRQLWYQHCMLRSDNQIKIPAKVFFPPKLGTIFAFKKLLDTCWFSMGSSMMFNVCIFQLTAGARMKIFQKCSMITWGPQRPDLILEPTCWCFIDIFGSQEIEMSLQFLRHQHSTSFQNF